MALTDKSKTLMHFLQDHQDGDYTAADVAEVLGIEKRSVDGTFTSLQKKELGYREEAERENDEGKHDRVKFLRLTAKGLAIDPDTYEEEKKEK